MTDELHELVASVSVLLTQGLGSNKFLLMTFPEGGVTQPSDGVVSSNASREEVVAAMKVFVKACEKKLN